MVQPYFCSCFLLPMVLCFLGVFFVLFFYFSFLFFFFFFFFFFLRLFMFCYVCFAGTKGTLQGPSFLLPFWAASELRARVRIELNWFELPNPRPNSRSVSAVVISADQSEVHQTCPYNLTTLNPPFRPSSAREQSGSMVKLGFTGVYIIFAYFCSET